MSTESPRKQRIKDSSHAIRNVTLAGGATIVVVGAGGVILHETVPAIERSVDQVGDALKHWAGIGVSAQTGEIDPAFEKPPQVEVPSTFDPTAKEGVVGENNTVVTSPQEYKASGLSRRERGSPERAGTMYIGLMYIQNPDGSMVNLQYEIKDSGLGTSNDMIVLNPINPEDIQPGAIIYSNMEGVYTNRGRSISIQGENRDGSPLYQSIGTAHGGLTFLPTGNTGDTDYGTPLFRVNENIANRGNNDFLKIITPGSRIAINPQDGKAIVIGPQPSDTSRQAP